MEQTCDPTELSYGLFMDSRGRDIKEELEQLDLSVMVLIYPGAGIAAVAKRAIANVGLSDLNIVVISAGICDITTLNRRPKGDKYKLRFSDLESATSYFKKQLHDAHALLKNHFSNSVVIITTVIGIDLIDYNCPTTKLLSMAERSAIQAQKIPHKDQDLLNNIIYNVNHMITQTNIDNKAPTPWTASVVHRWYKHTHHNAYIMLTDGCHYSKKLRKAWAKKLYIALKKLQISGKPVAN